MAQGRETDSGTDRRAAIVNGPRSCRPQPLPEDRCPRDGGHSSTTDPDRIVFRLPRYGDGARVWALVRDAGALELNTPYCYLMMCGYFGATCLLAEQAGGLVGAVIGFAVPDRPDTVFVWQVGVAATHRGLGLATALLERLVRQTRARFIEATVTPSNDASQRLFLGLARRSRTGCETCTGFPASAFPGGAHEEEVAFRVGPFNAIEVPADLREGDEAADGDL